MTSCDIRDIAYDPQRKILLTLNWQTGMLSLQLTFGGSMGMKVTSSVISIPNCEVIYYDTYQEELYLSCDDLHKYRISEWPVIAEKVLPKQDITIREITTTKELLALVGRNVFEIIAADRKTAIYRDHMLDKLILTDSVFVSAN